MDEFWKILIGGLVGGAGKEFGSFVISELKDCVSGLVGSSSRREELEKLGLLLNHAEGKQISPAEAAEISNLIGTVSAADPNAAMRFEAAKQRIEFFQQNNTYGQNIRDVHGDVRYTYNFAPPQPNPPATNVSVNNTPARNPHFTGRVELLATLRKRLLEGGKTALTALNGMGGIGKTQVATEYCHIHKDEYDVIWWIEAETDPVLRSQFGRLAHKLELIPETIEKEDVLHEAVIGWLRRPQPADAKWLLVLDNARDEEQLTPFIGHGGGHVIITSRNPYFGDYGLEVEKMLPQDAIDFLLERTGLRDKAGAAKVAKELDYLPLALEQAGAYILKRGRTFERYLEEYKQTGVRLFEHEKAKVDPKRYSKSVLTTWTMSIEAAKEKCELAGGVLEFFAFLAPDNIPLDLLEMTGEMYEDALEALRDYSLIKRTGDHDISLHRLVQEVTRDKLTLEEQQEVLHSAVVNVSKFPDNIQTNVAAWPDCARLLPHGVAVAEHSGRLSCDTAELAVVLIEVGLYLHHISANFVEAKASFERALKIDEAVFGPNHPEVATVINNLGSVLQAQGDFTGAKAAFVRALPIFKKELGDKHPYVAMVENNLGSVLEDNGDYPGAQAAYERALPILKKELGDSHPSVAVLENNLGSVLQAQGDYPGAKAAYERAMVIDEAAFGPNHPKVAIRLNNLGGVQIAQNNYAGAKKAFVRALRVFRVFLPSGHPNVATVAKNLATLLSNHPELRDDADDAPPTP